MEYLRHCYLPLQERFVLGKEEGRREKIHVFWYFLELGVSDLAIFSFREIRDVCVCVCVCVCARAHMCTIHKVTQYLFSSTHAKT